MRRTTIARRVALNLPIGRPQQRRHWTKSRLYAHIKRAHPELIGYRVAVDPFGTENLLRNLIAAHATVKNCQEAQS